MTKNDTFKNLLLDFEKANAAVDAANICKPVAATLTNTELNKYRDKGTRIFSSNEGKAVKLLKVGFLTKKRGGNTKSSSNGLNAVLIQ